MTSNLLPRLITKVILVVAVATRITLVIKVSTIVLDAVSLGEKIDLIRAIE